MSEENQKPGQEKKESTVDHIVMGAIIGTAIGSAIGLSVAPKKGSETRSLAKETASGILKFGKSLLRRTLKKIVGTKQKEAMKEIPNEMEIIPPKTANHE